MTIETAESISKAFDNKLRVIKFALRGEHLLNPDLNQIVNILHKNNPDTVLLSYTNGKLLTHKKIEELFTNGLNYIYVNAYNNTFKEYRKKYENYDLIDLTKTPFDTYEDIKNTDNKILLADDLKNYPDKIWNHAGNNDSKNLDQSHLSEPLEGICLRPFRDIIIKYDGTVSLCCSDANNDINLGNINNDTLENIWINNPLLNSIRRKLMMNDRKNISLCKKCNFVEYRKIGI